VRARVQNARAVADLRNPGGVPNGRLRHDVVAAMVGTLDPSAHTIIDMASDKLGLSVRTVHRAVRVARTIADLAGHDRIQNEHLLEALRFRPTIDRRG
jgi:magnesium chelatase family protein